MKIENSRAAVRWFDRVPVDRDAIPVEPADPGTVHAYLFDPDPMFASQTLKWILKQPGTALLEDGAEEAACGIGVRVVYRMAFDTGDPEACERCLEMADLWQANRNEYRRRVEERHERWRDRDRRQDEAFDAEDLARQNAFEDEPDHGPV
jgi:hypothetical protein